MQSLVLTGAGRPRRYRQGHGYRRRYRQGRGPKLQKFKGFMKKAASFGKQHILPHLQEIGKKHLTGHNGRKKHWKFLKEQF